MGRILTWSLDRVLTLLETDKYDNQEALPMPYNLLKKAIFLTALASGNRVSEIAAIDATGALEGVKPILTLSVNTGLTLHKLLNSETDQSLFSFKTDICELIYEAQPGNFRRPVMSENEQHHWPECEA